MTTIYTPVSELASIRTAPEPRGLIALYAELTKARLSALVLLTTAVGFILASSGGVDWLLLMWTVIGTALAAGCASALNQIIEINLDKRMIRTHGRPLPSGAMSVAHCFAAAMIMGASGLIILVLFVNLAAGWLALATIVIYAIVYTPMKVRSTLNTIVGAICGAIPPMIGWVAASNTLDTGAWLLAAILFVWQLPHFFALAWLYREDYARGGYAMLPVVDRKGQVTCQVIVLTSLMLLPLALAATLLSIAGMVFAIGSLLLGAWMTVLGVQLYHNRTDANARRVFFASITYLPVVLCLMVIDRGHMTPASIAKGPAHMTSAGQSNSSDLPLQLSAATR
jgi:heme o synthase